MNTPSYDEISTYSEEEYAEYCLVLAITAPSDHAFGKWSERWELLAQDFDSLTVERIKVIAEARALSILPE